MSNSGVVIPSDISKLLNERVGIWQPFDEAQSQFEEIDKLSSQVASINPGQIPVELTSEKTPPAEVAAAYHHFQAELVKIVEAQEHIKAYQTEIQKIENRQKTIAVLIGLAIIVFMAIAACGVLAIINSLLSNL